MGFFPPEERKRLRGVMTQLGIYGPGHHALKDRFCLGQYLTHLTPPPFTIGSAKLDEWRENRRVLSRAGVEALREVFEDSLTPPPAAPISPEPDPQAAPPSPLPAPADADAIADPPTSPASPEVPSASESEAPSEPVGASPQAPPTQYIPVIARIRDLTGQMRYKEAIEEAVRHYAEDCEECLVDAAVEVGRAAGRWDRGHKPIAPTPLFDQFQALAKEFGKHVAQMRHFDDDPLRATSHLYSHATKIFEEWVAHCAACLEHQMRRSNDAWQQREWIDPQKFGCLLPPMRSAVHEKIPLDLMMRVYQRIREVIQFGHHVIVMEAKRYKFEGDCLRFVASPTKDLIPDLTYLIFRHIIDCYVAAGETANAMTFCNQVLLLRRGDREVMDIREELRKRAGTRVTIQATDPSGRRW